MNLHMIRRNPTQKINRYRRTRRNENVFARY